MKKLLSLTAILACASCLGAYADDNATTSAKKAGSGGILSFGTFYAIALDDIYDDTEKIDFYGVTLDYEFPSLVDDGKASLAPFIESMLGAGYTNDIGIIGYDGGYYQHSTAHTYVTHWTLAVGARSRYQITRRFALTANAKIGLDVEYLKIDPKYYFSNEDDVAAGLLWGAGVGAEFQISDCWGLFLGLDYLSSSAQPDLDGYGKAEKQSYLAISWGATVRF